MGFFTRSNSPQNPSDEQAVERYRYMLRTAPPGTIEQAHEEAFSRLTPEQRRLVLEQLARVSTPEERQQASEDPGKLARLATRAEIRQPGVLERLFGSIRGGPAGYGAGTGGGAGVGLGGMFAGSLLGSIAGTVLGSAIAHSFFDEHPFQEGTADLDSSAGLADSEALGGEPEAFAESDPGAFEQSDADTFGLDDFGGGFDDV